MFQKLYKIGITVVWNANSKSCDLFNGYIANGLE